MSLYAAVAAVGVLAFQAVAGERLHFPDFSRAEEGRPILTGKPTSITDGDTLRLGATRIRLEGIDAPELSTANGQPARRHLVSLIGNGVVRCTDTGERSYDRVVAICHGADGQDLAMAMVRDGWATDWRKFSGGRYAGAQADAMRARRGMYAED